MTDGQDDPLAGIDTSQYAPDAAAPPAAPASDPSDPLHGVDLSQYTPEKEGSAPAAAPPAAAPDYANMGWGTALGKGIASSPQAAGSIVKNLGVAGLEATKNTLETGDLPGAGLVKAGDAWIDRNVPGAHWLNQKLGYQAPATDADYQKTTQPLTGIAQNYADRYGSSAGIKKTLATDLPGMALDVASVADPALRVGRATGLVGKAAEAAAPATEAELGQHFSDAAAASKNAVKEAYDTAYHTPGTFDPSAATPIAQEAVDTLASEPGFPKDWDELSRSNHLPQTRAALLNLQDHLQNINPQGIDMPGLENIRRSLRSYSDAAQGTDQHFIGKLIEGFDNGVANAATDPELFNGNGSSAVQAMQDARAAHVEHLNNFGSLAPSPVRAAMKSLGSDLSSVTPEQTLSAGTSLKSGLLNKGNGSLLHGHLTSVGVPEDRINSLMQQRMLEGSKNAVKTNLNNPVAQKVFGDELPRAQRLAGMQGSKQPSRFGPVIGAATDAALTGFGALHGAVPAVMGHFAKKGIERLLPGAPAVDQTPLYEQFATPKPRITQTAAQGAPNAPIAGVANTYGREQHASGGAVKGHQHLVDRLFREVEKAKRAEKQHTSVILNQPDEAVAKALNVAQQAI